MIIQYTVNVIQLHSIAVVLVLVFKSDYTDIWMGIRGELQEFELLLVFTWRHKILKS